MRLALFSLLVLGGVAAGSYLWLNSRPATESGTRVALDLTRPGGVKINRTAPAGGSNRPRPTNGHAGNGYPPNSGYPSAGGPVPRSATVVPALLEKGPHGDLPRIARDGRAAWRVYGRPFNQGDPRPRIAVIITDLGLKRDVTEGAIEDLPAVVSLAFSPYGRDLDSLAAAARRAGHEVLIALPLETKEDAVTDPGPRALGASQTPQDMMDRLHWIMGRARAYVGLVAWPVGLFGKEQERLNLVLAELRKRGIAIVDGRPGEAGNGKTLLGKPGVVWSKVTVWLDLQPSPAAIEAAFAKAEKIARTHGWAVVIGRPYPLTLTRVRGWLEGFGKKGLVAAPVTAVVRIGQGEKSSAGTDSKK